VNIILDARTKEHVQTFWERTQDEEIKRLFPFSTKSLEDALQLFERSQLEGATSYGKVIYCDGQYIGDVWCYGIDEDNEKMAMLSIVIFEKAQWGKGIGVKAAEAFVEEVFDKFNIEKLGAFTYSINYGSIGLLKKLGFVEVETFIENGVESKYFELNK